MMRTRWRPFLLMVLSCLLLALSILLPTTVASPTATASESSTPSSSSSPLSHSPHHDNTSPTTTAQQSSSSLAHRWWQSLEHVWSQLSPRHKAKKETQKASSGPPPSIPEPPHDLQRVMSQDPIKDHQKGDTAASLIAPSSSPARIVRAPEEEEKRAFEALGGSLLLCAFTTLLAFLLAYPLGALVRYFYIRRPSTGYISGNESLHVLSTGRENVPTIHAVIITKGQVTTQAIIAALEKAGIPDRRFQRLRYPDSSTTATTPPLWPLYFYPEPDFSVEHHVRYLEDPQLNHGRLLELLSSMMSTPPSFNRSPWEVLVSRGFEGSDGSTAIILRVHHVLADGLALITMCDAITKPLNSQHQPNNSRSSLSASFKVGLRSLVTAGWMTWLVLWLRLLYEFPIYLVRDYLLVPHEDNIFKTGRQLSGRKRIGWNTSSIDISRVRAVKEAYGVTVNDIILACAVSALKDMADLALEEEEKKIQGRTTGTTLGEGGRTCPNNDHIKEMKLYLPISVRTSLEKMEDLDNQLSVVILRLPFEEEDKVKRLHRIAKAMQAKKASVVPWGLAILWKVMGYAPRRLLQKHAEILCDNGTAVLTNVPGPSGRMALCGQPIEEVMFCLPAMGSLGVVLSILTYQDKLSVAIVVDDALPLDPQVFLTRFTAEFEELEERRTGTTHSQ